MNRRAYVTGAAGASLAALAGCLDDFGSDGGGDDEEADETHGAVAAVEAYLEAAQAGDEERLSEVTYDDSPVDPEWAERMADESEGEWELQEGDDPSYEDVEVELLEEGVERTDVEHVQHLEFWFEDEDLQLIDGDGTALVRTTWTNADPGDYGSPDELEEENHWILYTADDEWRILWTGRPHGTRDDFQEPVTDDEGRLVEGIEYVVQELDADGELAELYDGNEVHTAQVNFVDDPDPAVDGARVESTIALGSSGIEPVGSAAMLSAEVDPGGDEVTVYAIVDGEQEVVHRERYEP